MRYQPSALPSVSPSPTATFSSQPSIAINEEFDHIFINTTVQLMQNLVGVNVLRTPNGTRLSNFIHETREKLGLFEVLGCSANTYNYKSAMSNADSLWGLYVKEVVPKELFSKYAGNNNVFIQGTGAFRYNLFKGNVTLNDLISASPFNDTIYIVDSKTKGSDIFNAFGEPNKVANDNDLPYFAFAGAENLMNSDATYRVFTADFDLNYIKEALSTSNRTLEPIELDGVTTGTMWSGFINSTWPCYVTEPQEEEPKGGDKNDFLRDFFEEFTVMKVIAFILTSTIIVAFGCMFSYSKSGNTSDLNILDDTSVDEFSSSETSQSNSVDMMAKGNGIPSPPIKSWKKTTYQSIQQKSFQPADSELI